MLFWISDANALTGPIPSELGFLIALARLDLGKSPISFNCVNLCDECVLTCLDDLLDFRSERLDWSDTF
jgi:hypothetical protein